MLERVFIAGSGGQGVILMGKLLALAALDEVRHITFFPVYTAEVRGGTANCQVVLSSEEIASPVCERFDSLILMNQASVDSFLALGGDGCLALVNQSLCRQGIGRGVPIGATEAADRLGDARTTNMVMLGAYLGRKAVLSPAGMEREIRQVFAERSEGMADRNVEAFRLGLRLGGPS